MDSKPSTNTFQSGMLKEFLQSEASGGILLMLTAILALIIANSPLSPYYAILLDTPVEIRIGAFEIAKPLLLWINDGLMAIFFFMVGLELKREVLTGELSSPSSIMLPGLGAIGGIVVPVGIYVYFNHGDESAMLGWAIPAATDIAFALGILMLLGPRVPIALKVFLASLAIFDDLGAIIIIAIFYTTQLSLLAMSVAGVCLVVLSYMSWRRVATVSSFILVGVVMWAAVLKSGVHATLAGVALAFFIPMKDPENPERSPLRELEHDLHSVVAFGVLNAGVPLFGMSVEDAMHPVPLGIALGLFVGKQVGVFLFCALAIKFGLAKLPRDANWGSFYGVCILSGIGFTMSLFIGGLAFENIPMEEYSLFDERLGILIGSLASGLFGYLVLRWSLKDS